MKTINCEWKQTNILVIFGTCVCIPSSKIIHSNNFADSFCVYCEYALKLESILEKHTSSKNDLKKSLIVKIHCIKCSPDDIIVVSTLMNCHWNWDHTRFWISKYATVLGKRKYLEFIQWTDLDSIFEKYFWFCKIFTSNSYPTQ